METGAAGMGGGKDTVRRHLWRAVLQLMKPAHRTEFLTVPDWADHAPLRGTTRPLNDFCVLFHRRGQPSFDAEQSPDAFDISSDRLQQETMRKIAEQPIDVEFQNPIVLPTPLTPYHFFNDLAHLNDAAVFSRHLACARSIEWVVYASRLLAVRTRCSPILADTPIASLSSTGSSRPGSCESSRAFSSQDPSQPLLESLTEKELSEISQL